MKPNESFDIFYLPLDSKKAYGASKFVSTALSARLHPTRSIGLIITMKMRVFAFISMA